MSEYPTSGASMSPQLFSALEAFNRGQQEQILIERTIGKAFLDKLSGRSVDLAQIYSSLGGTDPVVQYMMSGDLNTAFKDLRAHSGMISARASIGSPGFKQAVAAKSAKASVRDPSIAFLERNKALTRVDGQALKTLTDLGGPEFVDENRLDL